MHNNLSTSDETTLRRALNEIKSGRYEATLPALETLSNPDSTEALTLKSFCLAGMGKTEEAASLLCQVAALTPLAKHPLEQLVDIMISQERRDDSLPVCRAVIKRTPQDARVYDIMGHVLTQMGELTEAVDIIRQASDLRPDCILSKNTLAMALAEKGDMEEALAILQNTLKQHPDNAATLSNAAIILANTGRFDESLDLYRRSIYLRPDHAQIRLNHSIALLKAGRFTQGWTEHEWRLDLPGHTSLPRETLLPTLTPDTDISGKRILITQEEGLGDTLMYLRYIEPLAKRGAIPHLWVPGTLEALCKRVKGAAHVQVGGSVPEFDWHCPFISLPRVFAATEEKWGSPVPFLSADPVKVKKFTDLMPDNGKLNVGIIWGGSPRPTLVGAHLVDRRRSMHLDTLAPLGKLRHVNLISVQKGPYAGQTENLPEGMTLYDPTDDLNSMDDTAALIMALDVLVSVDTSCVHLAGGLGNPVIMMDRYDNCWRWLHKTSTSHWYPSLQIVRQEVPRQWKPVVENVCAILRKMAREKSK